MGDDDERAAPVAEKRFEPFGGVDIEVVGGLVEEQYVGGREQQAGDGEAGFLAAGKPGAGFLLVGLAEAEALENSGNVAELVEAAHDLETLAKLAVLLHGGVLLVGLAGVGGVGHERGQLGETRFHLAYPAESFLGFLEDGALGIDDVFLPQVAGAHAFGELGGALVGFHDSGKNAQQGGFAGAVASNEAQLLPPPQREADALEEGIGAVGFF